MPEDTTKVNQIHPYQIWIADLNSIDWRPILDPVRKEEGDRRCPLEPQNVQDEGPADADHRREDPERRGVRAEPPWGQ